jgi:hypothetical protein
MLAVPLMSDFNVKNPPVFNVAPEPTITFPDAAPAIILIAFPKVAVVVPERVKFFNILVVPAVV